MSVLKKVIPSIKEFGILYTLKRAFYYFKSIKSMRKKRAQDSFLRNVSGVIHVGAN